MHSPADGRASGFLPDVQGLRALAVLLVVLYHASVPGWSGGYVGVDVFFVISGYLIGGMLVREREATGRIAFAAFYARSWSAASPSRPWSSSRLPRLASPRRCMSAMCCSRGDRPTISPVGSATIVAAKLDAELISLTKSACPSVEVPIFATENGGRSIDCDEWRANMIRRIVAERPMLVVIANYWHNIAADSAGRPTTTSPAEWRAGLDALALERARLPLPRTLARRDHRRSLPVQHHRPRPTAPRRGESSGQQPR